MFADFPFFALLLDGDQTAFIMSKLKKIRRSSFIFILWLFICHDS